MTISAISSGVASSGLVKLANGEYTAASVIADAKEATRLNLVKEPDGNYGAAPAASSSADAKSSTSVLSALTTMKLGGA